MLIQPHGGTLIDRVLKGEERDQALALAQQLIRIPLDETALADLEMIAHGAMSPLTGFMNQADYLSVIENLRLTNGLIWSIPLTLALDEALATSLTVGQQVTLIELIDNVEHILAILTINDIYQRDLSKEAEWVYQTTESAHPGVARIYAQSTTLIGGDIDLINLPALARNEFPDIRFTPAQSRQNFEERGWTSIVGFQTRNPIHRAHEYLQKTALEMVDGLFLHPLVGTTKSDDVPANVRIESYRAILQHYYPQNRVILGAFPAAMRYAGPREALFHALIRKNYGCSHFIVGRDHAGVGNYYGTYDAQKIFDQFDPSEIGIIPLRFEHAFYCKKCAAVVTAKTCPHPKEDWLHLSGTQVREKLNRGESLPAEFTRPEINEILLRAVRERLQPV